MRDTKFIPASELGAVHFSSGTWTLTKTSNIVSYDKTAGDTTDTITCDIPLFGEGAYWGGRVKSVGMLYEVVTAALDAAPTIVLDKLTLDATTKAVSRAAVTQTKTVAGTDTTGTAVGKFALIATVADADLVATDENVRLQVQGTFNGAATGVVKFYGLEVQYA